MLVDFFAQTQILFSMFADVEVLFLLINAFYVQSGSSITEPPIVKTESVTYDPKTMSPNSQAQPTTHVPVVQTETRKVICA